MLVDCRWSAFGNWSSCSQTCDYGSKIAQRTVEQPALYGGEACIGDAVKMEKCRNIPCPGMRIKNDWCMKDN